MIDIKKVLSPHPENIFDAITHMVKLEQKLINALFIMQSVVDNPDEKEYYEKGIKKFLEQFQED